jgi:hypothetical protein
MTYACPAWEFEIDIHLIKLQLLENRVLCTIGIFPNSTSVRDRYVAFQIVYDYVTESCRQQAQLFQNHDNVDARILDKTKTSTENIRGLSLTARPIK